MERPVRNLVIVGGGTAGWLAACRIGARRRLDAADPISVTLIEAPDIPTIGVGEGTWPTMRKTLEQIGIDEADFLLACDASLKQGSRFDGWVTGEPSDRYLHPFAPPAPVAPDDLIAAWLEQPDLPFARAVSPQQHICDLGLAPKQKGMPSYAGALNYGYHLDAGKLAALLARHATTRLGVRHIRDQVTRITATDNGDIATVETRSHGAIAGDLFIDCTGHASLLLGGHFGINFVDRSPVLFNDRALAVQVPVDQQASAIASQTISTAHAAGWIWDIGLPTRRGVGCVYASSHLSDEQAAETLAAYVAATSPQVDASALGFRALSFRSGHRERFWHRNCLAIGLSAGFLEPLEASAIVLIELSLDALLAGFPADRALMDIHAGRFNQLFRYRWDRIIDFLKLHYVLSQRPQPYWQDHRAEASIPQGLRDLLQIWQYQAPSDRDFAAAGEIFPAASYQYILYGMGHSPSANSPFQGGDLAEARKALEMVRQKARVLASGLPSNRAYLASLQPARQPLQERTG